MEAKVTFDDTGQAAKLQVIGRIPIKLLGQLFLLAFLWCIYSISVL